MSNPESFIDEVTEEVRRDKLFGYFRRYGWIAVLAVVMVVGGAAYNEWQKARHQAESEAFGDAVLAALDAPDGAARIAGLQAISSSGPRAGVLGLMIASDPVAEKAATLAALDAVAADATLPTSYRDLATLRHVIVAGSDMTVAERRALLDPIAAPGRPFRPLALEQLALLMLEEGQVEVAIKALQDLGQMQESPPGQRRRIEQLTVALGAAPAAE